MKIEISEDCLRQGVTLKPRNEASKRRVNDGDLLRSAQIFRFQVTGLQRE